MEMKERLKGVWLLLIFFALQYGAAIALTTVLGVLGKTEILNSQEALAPLIMISVALFQGIFFIVIVRRYRDKIISTFKDVFSNKLVLIKKMFLYAVLYIVFMQVFSMIDGTFFAQYAEEIGENQEYINNVLEEGISWSMVASIVFFAPIIEEYVFRYGVMSKLLAGMNKYAAAVVSAFFFAFIHIGVIQMFNISIGHTIHLMLGYIPVSLALSLMYAREENLFYPILIHFANNLLSIAYVFAAYIALIK